MRILAIDPGPLESGWLLCDTAPFTILECGVMPNGDLLSGLLGLRFPGCNRIVIEQVESFGMAVGASVFGTVFWSGRFAQAAVGRGIAFDRLGRKAVKLHLCGTYRAKDANIRQSLIDRFGGEVAIGRKVTPGPLYLVRSHAWPALALAVTWSDQNP